MMKALGRRALSPFLGRRHLQGLFQGLVDVGLAGLNLGEGNHPATSGERWVAQYVRDSCVRGAEQAVLFDVVANVGDYTRTLLEVFPSSAQIWAFEPAKETFRILEGNLSGIEGVQLRRIGLSDEKRTASFYSPGPASKLGSVHDIGARLERRSLAVALEEEVTLTTLDLFCEAQAVDHIDFLKLDVEGHELAILRGAKNMIQRDAIGAIQFEFGLANLDSRTYFRDFFAMLSDRYSLHRVLKNGLYPIFEYSEALEVFKRATNYLALSRI
jgi:FkbM family methyltransferase